jgi:UDP-3-O-[3-hydroxymyristoyl] glucosamine N-acyltransferase
VYITKKMVERSVVSKIAKIRSGCYISGYVVIGDSCTIGDNTIIYDRVGVLQNWIFGKECHLLL